jgi:hypothetical protein
MRSIKILFFIFLISINIVQAESARIYLNPSSNMDNLGNTFSVDVKIDTNDMYSHQFKLSWDKNILELTSAIPHPENLWRNYLKFQDNIVPGQYSIAYTAANPTLTGFTGTASITTLNFKVKGIGYTKISFSGVIMLDSNSKDISFNSIDGSFDNRKIGTRPIIRVRSIGTRTLGISDELIQSLMIVIALIVLAMTFIAFKFFARRK